MNDPLICYPNNCGDQTTQSYPLWKHGLFARYFNYWSKIISNNFPPMKVIENETRVAGCSAKKKFHSRLELPLYRRNKNPLDTLIYFPN